MEVEGLEGELLDLPDEGNLSGVTDTVRLVTKTRCDAWLAAEEIHLTQTFWGPAGCSPRVGGLNRHEPGRAYVHWDAASMRILQRPLGT